MTSVIKLTTVVDSGFVLGFLQPMKHREEKQVREERSYFPSGSQGRNSTRTGGRSHGGCCLLVVPHGLLSWLSYRTQDHQARDGTTHSGLGSPSSMTD